MLFKFSLNESTLFIKNFIFDAKTATIMVLDNELSNTKLQLPIENINAPLLSKMFNTMMHKLMQDSFEKGKPWVYVNLRYFIENYEGAVLDDNAYSTLGYDAKTGTRKVVSL